MPHPRPVTDRMSDEELVAAFIGGSEDAFTMLVGRYKDPIVNFAWRIVGDRDAAADVAQEAFVRLHAKAHTYRPVAKFSTWFYTIASNLAKTELRRRRWGVGRRERNPEAFDPGDPALAPDTEPLPDDMADRALERDALERALRSLPEGFRQAVVLFYLEEKSYEEICAILGVRMGTLKSRLNRARAMLEASLAPLMARSVDGPE